MTSGARGIAYSCLLDCLCAGNQHRKGWEALQVTSDAIKLDLSTCNEIEAESRLGLCYISQGQNNFAHWSTQTFYLNAIKIYFLFACKTKQNGVLLLCFLIVYMSFWNHIKYIHWTWFDQEALGANVALEDINRTALVRLKQVGFNPISYFFHKVIIRAWKNLARASHTKFPPRTQRRTLRTAAWVLLTGLRCRNDQYFCTNGHWFDGTLLLHVLQNFQNFAHEASQTSKIIHTEKGLGQ